MRGTLYSFALVLASLALAGCEDPAAPSSTSGTTPPPGGTPPPATGGAPATIAFTSATPVVVGLQGSGQSTNSTLLFTVRDAAGVAVANGHTVNFTINNLNGNEYIGVADNTPTQASAQTSGNNGQVSIGLTSGTVAGVIIVNATVNGTSITAESSKISIGGGVADSAHLSLATSQFSLAGYVLDGVPATITARLGDRFGNYNVLEGTPVSFYAEAGTIDTSNVTDGDGVTDVIYRTQNPRPDTASVAITQAEITAINDINAFYNLPGPIPNNGTVTPRRGWATVLATVAGQETFTDSNANGYYDAGDIFTAADDLGEPYIDRNSNGQWDVGETYIDTVTNGVYNGPNGVWDGPNCPGVGCQSSKTIWDAIQLIYTGDGAYCAFSDNAAGASIVRTMSEEFWFMVGDANLNRLVPGTRITVTTSAGQLSGNTNYTVPDGEPYSVPGPIGQRGPTEISFTLLNNLAQNAQATTATITVTVTPPAGIPIVGCPGNQAKTVSVNLL